MPNYKTRGKFKLTVGNVPPENVGMTIERIKVSVEQVAGISQHLDERSRTVLLSAVHDGWLHVAVNLKAGQPESTIRHDFGVRLTDVRNDHRADEDEAIVALRNSTASGKRPHSAAFIARKLKLPIDRVKRVLYRRQTVRNG